LTMWKEYPQYYELALWTDFGAFLLCLCGLSYLTYRLAVWYDERQ